MAGASDATDSGTRPGWRWDVALSFAGAQRDYVEQVAQVLKAQGVRCFYDADEEIELWGKYLAEELPLIYGEQAAAAVVFVSAEYAARDWTRLERRAALARAVRERREYVLPARFDDTPLPGLLPDVSYVDLHAKTPQQFATMIAAKLAALGVAPPGPLADAGGLDPDAGSARPVGAVRVSDADPRRLGVHAAIRVPGVSDEVLPEYVPRDVDGDEHGIRARVIAATERGGFVLLVGGSSVGKTRCAVEALRALLPDWWLVFPAEPAEVAALSQAPSPQTVVWLDELQRYLDGEHGLTGGVVRALLNAPHPAVIIGTLWPDRYTAYTAVPVPGRADPRAREREVLELAAVVRIDPELSMAEQGRARAAAARDPRVRAALEAVEYGLTQTLAAAPQLVARWQDAKTAAPYAWAVLTAALDAARLGARAPLSADLLRAAAPGYCTSQQQAEAPGNWFEQALAYATEKLHGAAAALAPAGAGMGQVDGYTVADYLIQHASRERRYARVPISTWDAVVSYIRDPADTARLADSAEDRLLYRCAIPLYRHAAHAGDEHATLGAAELLVNRGELDDAAEILRARADEWGWFSGLSLRRAEWLVERLVDLLAERGDADSAIPILRAQAEADDWPDRRREAHLLAERGDLDKLRDRANGGDMHAAARLADLLVKRGDLDGAAQILHARTGGWGVPDAGELADVLAGRGDYDGVAQILRARADALDKSSVSSRSAVRLAKLLGERGDIDGLRARADAGDWPATFRLVDLLAEDYNSAAQILRARADAGDRHAASLLAKLLASLGDIDGLRALADSGDAAIARLLAELLAERDGAVQRPQVPHAATDGWDKPDAGEPANVLYERGDHDSAAQIQHAHTDGWDEPDAGELANVLYKRGDIDGLRVRADAGDWHAAWLLAELLVKRGDLGGAAEILCRAAQVPTKDWGPPGASELTNVLINQGRAEEAEQLRRFGLNTDGSIVNT